MKTWGTRLEEVANYPVPDETLTTSLRGNDDVGRIASDDSSTQLRWLLRFAHTCELQAELERRPGVRSIYVDPYEKRTVNVIGPCVVTINED